jgi:hypothetical protein
MVTVPPFPAVSGVKDDTVGAEAVLKVKPADVAMPPGVVTITLPEAPTPTATVIVPAVLVRIVAAVPPSVTDVAPVRFAPVIVTVAP